MKHALILVGVLLSMFPLWNHAADIELEPALHAGLRTFADKEITDTYGQGFVYNPSLTVRLGGSLGMGVSMDLGYNKEMSGKMVGPNSTFKVSGWEVFVSWRFQRAEFYPYVKGGVGGYTITRKFGETFPDLQAYDTDQRKTGWWGACGLAYYPIKNFFVAVESRYTLLRIDLDDRDVDLGGFRFFLGIGYTLNI